MSSRRVRSPKRNSPKDLYTTALPNLSLYADFWGPVSNFGIPIAAVMDTQKDPEMYATPNTSLPLAIFWGRNLVEVLRNEAFLTYGTAYPAA